MRSRKKNDEKEIIKDFIFCIKSKILEIDKQKITSEEKLQLLSFSILCLLDGVSGNFSGNINELSKCCKSEMLHENFTDDC